MNAFRRTCDLFKKGAVVNFLAEKEDEDKDEPVAFFEINGFATYLCCLNDVVLDWDVNPSGRRAIPMKAIAKCLMIRIQTSRGLRGFSGAKRKRGSAQPQGLKSA